MAYQKREPRHDWRSKLTDAERIEVEAIEREMKDLSDRRAKAASELGPIRNRAIQRARYEAATDTGSQVAA